MKFHLKKRKLIFETLFSPSFNVLHSSPIVYMVHTEPIFKDLLLYCTRKVVKNHNQYFPLSSRGWYVICDMWEAPYRGGAPSGLPWLIVAPQDLTSPSPVSSQSHHGPDSESRSPASAAHPGGCQSWAGGRCQEQPPAAGAASPATPCIGWRTISPKTSVNFRNFFLHTLVVLTYCITLVCLKTLIYDKNHEKFTFW